MPAKGQSHISLKRCPTDYVLSHVLKIPLGHLVGCVRCPFAPHCYWLVSELDLTVERNTDLIFENKQW